jgi:uncharacterized protein YegL
MRVYFIIDTSDSMRLKMDFLNSCMKETVLSLKNTFNIELAVLSFASDRKRHTNKLINIDNYEWCDIKAGGLCDMGKAFCEFRRANLLPGKYNGVFPVIILISNGNANDTKTEWKKELERLKQNKNFQEAIKVSIALGKGVFRDVLQEFSTNNTVLIPHNINMFKRIIKYAVIPRIFNVECCAGEDCGYEYEPWMVWGDHFFQEKYNFGHEYLDFYLWNKCFYRNDEDVMTDDIEIYRKRSNDSEIWWEEQRYNSLLDECIIYKTNVEKNEKRSILEIGEIVENENEW